MPIVKSNQEQIPFEAPSNEAISFPEPSAIQVPFSREKISNAGIVDVPEQQTQGMILARPTGMLSETGAEGIERKGTSNLRSPVVIGGTRSKMLQQEVSVQARSRLKIAAHISTLLGMFCMIASVLSSVLPTQSYASQGNTLTSPTTDVASVDGGSQADLAAQKSTPTVVVNLFPPTTGSTGGPPVAGSSGHFPGYWCTSWADMRYSQIRGVHVPWFGNAEVWNDQAPLYGWKVSTTPRAPSIVVWERYVGGVSGVGHVAIVESINGDGSLNTSHWNYNYPGPNTQYVTMQHQAGMSYVWFS